MKRSGMTLVELVIVIAIMAAMAALVVPMVGTMPSDSQKQVTLTNMTQLRDAIMSNYRADMNKMLPRPIASVSPTRSQTPQVRYLFVNPKTETPQIDFDPAYKLGWRGPYFLTTGGAYVVEDGTGGTTNRGFTHEFGEGHFDAQGNRLGDPAVMDGWGRPIVILERTDGAGIKHVWLMSAGADGFLTPPTSVGPGISPDDIVLLLY